MVVANGMRRRAGDCAAYLVEGCREVGDVAVGQGFEAEVEDAVELVEGNAHVEAGFGGGKAIAAGLLHDGEGIEVEPAGEMVEGWRLVVRGHHIPMGPVGRRREAGVLCRHGRGTQET